MFTCKDMQLGGVQYQIAPLKEAIRNILCCDFSKRSGSNKMSAHYTPNKGCYEDKCIIYSARASLCNNGIFLFVAVLLRLHLAVCRLWLQCFHHSWESLETPASDISMNLFQYGIFEVIMMGVFCTFFWCRSSDIIIEWYPVGKQFTNLNTDLNISMFLNALWNQ